jgi:hypothetical protein
MLTALTLMVSLLTANVMIHNKAGVFQGLLFVAVFIVVILSMLI